MDSKEESSFYVNHLNETLLIHAHTHNQSMLFASCHLHHHRHYIYLLSHFIIVFECTRFPYQ